MAICEDENEQDSLFDCLPDEILTKIFSHLSLKELCCSVRVVCQRWFNISYTKILWSKVTTEDIKELKDFSSFSLVQLIRLDSSSLKYLFLDNCYDIPALELLTIADLVPKLCELSLTFCIQVDKKILRKFSESCQEITALSLEGCEEITDDCLRLFAGHNISRLNLSHCNNLTDDSLLLVGNTFRNIKDLNIDGVQWISDGAVDLLLQNCKYSLQNLWLDGENLTDFALTMLSSCRKLRTLKISFCEQLTDLTLSSVSCIHTLKSLSLRKGKNFTREGIGSMFQNLQTGLLYLDFTDCQAFNDQVVQYLTQSSPDLITLDLSWCWDITDEGLGYVVCRCRRMKKLTLTGLHTITGEPLRDVVEKLPRLEYLDLTNCNSIQDNILRHVARQIHSLTILDYYGSIIR